MFNVNRIRDDFPLLHKKVYGQNLVYLDNAATTQKPNVVLDAARFFYTEFNSNIHRGTHYLSEKASEQYETARETVKKFINAKKTYEIVFTHGTTESINIVATCFGKVKIKNGDEIIITEMEHHSNFVPWQMLCKETGAVLKIVPFCNDGTLKIDVLMSLISDKTALLALTYVSNVMGVINPVKEIIAIAHKSNIPVLVDAAQAVQHMIVDVSELDCDFLVFSGHKMFAETGAGVLYGKEKWLELMPPYQFGGGMIASVNIDTTVFAELPFKFEAGTPNISGVISLSAAINYLNTICMNTINSYENELLFHAAKKLSSVDGIRFYGTTDNKCGIISFNLDGIGCYDVSVILDKMGIALRSGTHCAEPVMKHFGVKGTVRAGFALYNTFEEVDLLADGLKKVQSLLR
jgi:cysteine desulfurase / selenocysteine lyase